MSTVAIDIPDEVMQSLADSPHRIGRADQARISYSLVQNRKNLQKSSVQARRIKA